jgi:hypothetical protein
VRAPVSLTEVSPSDLSLDAIFQAFDGHDYNIDGTTCRVNVCGVHDIGSRKFVQLLAADAGKTMLTLALAEGVTALVSRIA